jgi:hypothetical protein
MPDETSLRAQAREAIRTGRLPRIKPSRRFLSGWSDVICPVCSDWVGPDQIQVQLSVGQEELYLHLPCCRAWELECTTPAELGEPPGLST